MYKLTDFWYNDNMITFLAVAASSLPWEKLEAFVPVALLAIGLALATIEIARYRSR